MEDIDSHTTHEVPLPADSPVREKFGAAVDGGFLAIPNILLKNQENLGLTSTNMVVLLNVLSYWWYPEKKPYPRSTTIAKRMGLSPRAVQRSLRQLQTLELLERERANDDRTYLNPEPLVERLIELIRKDVRHNQHNGTVEGGSGPNRSLPGHIQGSPF